MGNRINFNQEEIRQMDADSMFKKLKEIFEKNQARPEERLSRDQAYCNFKNMIGHTMCDAADKLTKEQFQVLLPLYDKFHSPGNQSEALMKRTYNISMKYQIPLQDSVHPDLASRSR